MIKKRIRVSTKETVKGLLYLDVTGGKVTNDILKVIQEKQKEFHDNNREMVGYQ